MTIGQKRRSKKPRAGVGKMTSTRKPKGTPKSVVVAFLRTQNTVWPKRKKRPRGTRDQSRKTENANACEGKKCLRDGNARIVFAPHPSARSRPCPCPGGSTPRYPAQPRPPSRTLKPVTTAEPRRASLSRFRSFLWFVMMEKGNGQVRRGTFSRSGARAGEAPVGFEGGDARAARDACRRRAPREPGAVEPWFATPRHAPGRVAGRPHSTRVALKTTTRTRDNE